MQEAKVTGGGSEDEVVKEGKIFALLAYLWILWIVPLLLKKDNKFAFFHGKQGLVMFLASIVIGIISIIPFIGWILGPLGFLALFIVWIIAIIQVLMGNYWRIPIIADIADKINI